MVASIRVIYGNLQLLVYLMGWSGRLAGAWVVATHLPLSVRLFDFELDPIPPTVYV